MSSLKVKKGVGKSKRKDDILAQKMTSRTGLKWMDGLENLDPGDMPPLRVLVKRPTASELPPYYRKLPVEQVKKMLELVESKELPRKELGRYWPWNFNAKGLVRLEREWRLSDPAYLHPKGIEAATFASSGKPMSAFFDQASENRRTARSDEALQRDSSSGNTTHAERAFSQTTMATNSFNSAQSEDVNNVPDDFETLMKGMTEDHTGCIAQMRGLRRKLRETERQLEAANERVATLEDYTKDLEIITEARIGTEPCDRWKQVMGDALRN